MPLSVLVPGTGTGTHTGTISIRPLWARYSYHLLCGWRFHSSIRFAMLHSPRDPYKIPAFGFNPPDEENKK